MPGSLFITALAASCLLASGAMAADTENAQIPLSNLFSKYGDYLDFAAGEKPAFAPNYRVYSKNGPVDDLSFSFSHAGETIRFAADAQGLIDYRPGQDLLAADPVVTVNQPKGTMKLDLTIEFLEPGRPSYDMRALHERAHAAWDQVKDIGGFGSLFAPSHTSLTATFDDTCPTVIWSVMVGTKQLAGGTTDGDVEIEFKKKKLRNADTLTFSCAPNRFLF